MSFEIDVLTEQMVEYHDLEIQPEFELGLEHLADLRRLQADIQAVNAISRDDAVVLMRLTTGLESADAHFLKHPLASYTRLASRVNLNVSLEGIASAIASTIKGIVKAVIKFFVELPRKIWDYLADRRKRLGSLSKMSNDATSVFTAAYNNRYKYPLIDQAIAEAKRKVASRWNMGLELYVGKDLLEPLTAAAVGLESSAKMQSLALANAEHWKNRDTQLAIDEIHRSSAELSANLLEYVDPHLTKLESFARISQQPASGDHELLDLSRAYTESVDYLNKHMDRLFRARDLTDGFAVWGKKFERANTEAELLAAVEQLFKGPLAKLQSDVLKFRNAYDAFATCGLELGKIVASEAKFMTETIKLVK